jgi:hypothetical protein
VYGGMTNLAEAGTLSMEFTSIGRLTGREEFTNAGMLTWYQIMQMPTIDGLYCTGFNADSLACTDSKYGFGAAADSAYEYMLKQWVLSKGEDKVGGGGVGGWPADVQKAQQPASCLGSLAVGIGGGRLPAGARLAAAPAEPGARRLRACAHALAAAASRRRQRGLLPRACPAGLALTSRWCGLVPRPQLQACPTSRPPCAPPSHARLPAPSCNPSQICGQMYKDAIKGMRKHLVRRVDNDGDDTDTITFIAGEVLVLGGGCLRRGHTQRRLCPAPAALWLGAARSPLPAAPRPPP